MSKEPQAIVALLDQQYEQLLVDARRLVTSYVDASMKLYKKTGARSVVAAVSIKQTSPNAYSIYWCKLVPLHGQKNKFAPLTIAKGNGNTNTRLPRSSLLNTLTAAWFCRLRSVLLRFVALPARIVSCVGRWSLMKRNCLDTKRLIMAVSIRESRG